LDSGATGGGVIVGEGPFTPMDESLPIGQVQMDPQTLAHLESGKPITVERPDGGKNFYVFGKVPVPIGGTLTETGAFIYEFGRIDSRFSIGGMFLAGKVVRLEKPFDVELPGGFRLPYAGYVPTVVYGDLPFAVPSAEGFTGNATIVVPYPTGEFAFSAQWSSQPVEPGITRAGPTSAAITLSDAQLDTIVAKIPEPARSAVRGSLSRMRFEYNTVSFAKEAWRNLAGVPQAVRERRLIEVGARLTSAFAQSVDAVIRNFGPPGALIRFQITFDLKRIAEAAMIGRLFDPRPLDPTLLPGPTADPPIEQPR
jgi:hypothetical protein